MGTPDTMRVLITNESLDQRAGSDLFIRDLARGLQQLGHFVIAYGSDPRQQARLLERDSISVATDLANLPFRPDIIHARHHLDAMTAVMALPGVPAVHHCIGPAWSIALPVHPRIYRYIAPSPGVAGWIAERGEIPNAEIDVLHNAVDLLRFARVGRHSADPQRLLVYDDELLPDSPVVIAVTQAAADLGLQLEMIGRRLGRAVDNPEARLPDYDIVCARGLKAIEALACGCAVVVVAPGHCGELVDERNFERLRNADFSVDAESPVVSVDYVKRVFGRHSVETNGRLTSKVRSICDFTPYAARIDTIYRAAIRMHEGHVEDLDAEQRATSAYLYTLSRMIKEIDQQQKAKGDIPLSTASMFLDVSAKLSAIQADLDKPQW